VAEELLDFQEGLNSLELVYLKEYIPFISLSALTDCGLPTCQSRNVSLCGRFSFCVGFVLRCVTGWASYRFLSAVSCAQRCVLYEVSSSPFVFDRCPNVTTYSRKSLEIYSALF
jgi:hypothetical protein